MSKTTWDRLDEDTFNKSVEALLVEEYTGGGLRAQAINGRGGDEGIDIDVRVERTGQLTHIFQLKHFPEGFSGGFRKRRDQIKKSFEDAMEQHQPPAWTLAFPKNPTLPERKFVFGLGGGRKVRIRIMGAAELDGLLSKHPHIESYLSRNEAVEVLRAINRPEAALVKPGDLHAEMARIQKGLDARSQYWRPVATFRPDGTYVETLHAKREDAFEREPLSITVDAEFGPGDEDLRKQFMDKMKYGGSGTIVLPERVIKEFRKIGPEWFAETSSGGEVHIGDAGESVTESIKAELYDADGIFLGQLSGTTKVIDRGYGGGTIENTFLGGLDLRWRFSDTFEEGGSVALDFDIAGATPREVRQALRFLEKLQPDTEIRLTVAGRPTIRVSLSDSINVDPVHALMELVDDLCIIEDKLDVTFRFTAEGADHTDRVWARAVVSMLDGKPVALPFRNSVTVTLSGTKDEGFERLLDKGIAIVVSHPEWALELFGATLRLGEVRLYTHHAVVPDRRKIVAAFEAGTAAGMKLNLRPVDEQPFVMYAPAYMSKDPDAVVKTYPWGLTGIPEHPEYDALPNRIRSAFEKPNAEQAKIVEAP
jgi:hypothetical protein